MRVSPPLHESVKPHGRDWWALLLIVLCYGFYNTDKSLISVLIEPIKQEFGLSDTQMGLLSGLGSSLPFALACIPVSMLGDRVNRRNLLALLVAAWSAVTGMTAFVGSILALFVTQMGVGAMEAGFTPISLSSLTDSFSPTLRSTAIGLFNLGAALGLFIGMSMGGFVEARWGWRAAFLVAGVPGLVLAVLLWLTTNEPKRGGNDDAPSQASGEYPSLIAVLRHLCGDKALRNILAAMTWGAAMLAIFAIWTPSLLRRSFALDADEAGLQSGLIVGIGGALGAASGGILADRLGRWRVADRLLVPIAGTTLSLLIGVTALLGNWSPGLTTALLGIAVFFGQFYIGPGYALGATLAGPGRRAVTLSIFLLSFNMISYSVGAAIVGKLSDLLTGRFGTDALRHAYLLSFFLFVPATAHFWRAYHHLARAERGAAGSDTTMQEPRP